MCYRFQVAQITGTHRRRRKHSLRDRLTTQLAAVVDHIVAPTISQSFDNAPLTDHYYDFQAYRLFMQRIPSRWRNLPVYITETNPLFKTAEPDWGWIDEDRGWIRAAFQEINDWNHTPHVQQIRALLLYRWAGDAWIMQGKGNLVNDFRSAMARDYRWRA